MPDAWEQCGFVEGKAMPLLYPSMAPMNGLYAAMYERGLFTSRGIKKLETIGNLSSFDGYIASICTEYMNHLSSERKYWNWNDLCDATLNITGDSEIYTVERLMPQLSVIYARQRYVMINLLKVYGWRGEVYLTTTSCPFDYGGQGSTIEEAYSDYLTYKETHSGETKRHDISETHVPLYYGGTYPYRFNAFHVTKISNDLYPNAKIWIHVPEQTYRVVDFFGTSLSLGWNRFQLDANGELNWNSSDAMTAADHEIIISGWSGNVYIDHSSTFQYYHDVDPA